MAEADKVQDKTEKVSSEGNNTFGDYVAKHVNGKGAIVTTTAATEAPPVHVALPNVQVGSTVTPESEPFYTRIANQAQGAFLTKMHELGDTRPGRPIETPKVAGFAGDMLGPVAQGQFFYGTGHDLWKGKPDQLIFAATMLGMVHIPGLKWLRSLTGERAPETPGGEPLREGEAGGSERDTREGERPGEGGSERVTDDVLRTTAALERERAAGARIDDTVTTARPTEPNAEAANAAALIRASTQSTEFAKANGVIKGKLQGRFVYSSVPDDKLNVNYNPGRDEKLRTFLDDIQAKVKDIKDPKARAEKAAELIRAHNSKNLSPFSQSPSDRQISDYYHLNPPNSNPGTPVPLGKLIEDGRLRHVDQAVLLKAVSDRFPDMNLSLVRGSYRAQRAAETTRAWVEGPDNLIYDPGMRAEAVKPGQEYGDGPKAPTVQIDTIPKPKNLWHYPPDPKDVSTDNLSTVTVVDPTTVGTANPKITAFPNTIWGTQYESGSFQLVQLEKENKRYNVISGSPGSLTKLDVEGGQFNGTVTRTYNITTGTSKLFDPIPPTTDLISTKYEVVIGNPNLQPGIYTTYPEPVVIPVSATAKHGALLRVKSSMEFLAPDQHPRTEYVLDTPDGESPIKATKFAQPVRDDALGFTSQMTIDQVNGLKRYYYDGVDFNGQAEVVLTDVYSNEHPLKVSFSRKGPDGIPEASVELKATRVDRHRYYNDYETDDGNVRTRISWRDTSPGASVDQVEDGFRESRLLRIGTGPQSFTEDPFLATKKIIAQHGRDASLNGVRTAVSGFETHFAMVASDLKGLESSVPKPLVEKLEGALKSSPNSAKSTFDGLMQLDGLLRTDEFAGAAFVPLKSHLEAVFADNQGFANVLQELKKTKPDLASALEDSFGDPTLRLEAANERNPQVWHTEDGDTTAVSIGALSRTSTVTGGTVEVYRNGTPYKPPERGEGGDYKRRKNGALDATPIVDRKTEPDPRIGEVRQAFTPDTPNRPELLVTTSGDRIFRPQVPVNMPIGDEHGPLSAEAYQWVGVGRPPLVADGRAADSFENFPSQSGYYKFYETNGKGVVEVYNNTAFGFPATPNENAMVSRADNNQLIGIYRRAPDSKTGDPGGLVIFHPHGGANATTEIRFAQNGVPPVVTYPDTSTLQLRNLVDSNNENIPILREDYLNIDRSGMPTASGIDSPYGRVGQRDTYGDGTSKLLIIDPASPLKIINEIRLDINGKPIPMKQVAAAAPPGVVTP